MFLVFGIAYNMQAEEILKPQRHLLNSKPSGRQSFSCCFAIRIQMTSPIDFFHSACAFFHSFVADQFHDLCFFFFVTDKWESKREALLQGGIEQRLQIFCMATQLAALCITVAHGASLCPIMKVGSRA